MKILKPPLITLLLIPSALYSQPRGTGMKFDLKLYAKADKADFSRLGFTAPLPASVSFKDYAPYPKDQGQTSTSVGWSTTYGALTIEYAKQMGLRDKNKITAKAFCPYFTYNQLRNPDDYTCRAGGYIYNALTALRTYGSKRYYLPVYQCGTKIDENALRNSKPFRVKSFKKLFDYPYETTEWSFETFYSLDIDKVTPVKQALAAGHAVPFGMLVPESFFYVTGTDLWEPTATELSLIPNLTTYGHAMCVVGYDDNKYGGAFEIMNSWGQNWANGGYCWLKYADFKKFVVDAYYMELFNESAGTKGCVSGDCYSTYSRMVFDSGDEYEGNFKNSVYDGYGIYIWADGHVYAGQWKNGKRDGLGTSIVPGGQPFTEYWKDDAPSLYSAIETKTVEKGCQRGDCYNGFGTYKYDNGTYTGTFSSGLRDGFGTYSFNDGGKITATWVADQVDGFGRLHYTDGWVYIGEFAFDMQDGFGLEYGIDGFVSGEWSFGVFLGDDTASLFFAGKTPSSASRTAISNLKPKMGAATTLCMTGDCTDGYGTMKYDTGDAYTGYFKGTYRDGYGIYTWANGTKYQGSWLAGNMDGVGKIYFPDGGCFIGEFHKGLQDGYGLEISSGSYTAGVWKFGKYQEGKTALGFTEFKKKKGTQGIDLKKITASSPASEKIAKAVAAKKAEVK
ncbi:MAG TPA: C1 family peptidase [Chitinophagales bacterium]|nr:C1 family peptidase [Chitinophagales bacterium]